MDEEQKIERLLEEYGGFFETTSADISKSVKGRRFFFYVDRISGDLFCLAEFTTAEELEQIILHEMAEQINMKLQNVIEQMDNSIKFIDVTYSACDFGKAVNQLGTSLEIIQKEFCQYFPEIKVFLQGIFTYINKHGESPNK